MNEYVSNQEETGVVTTSGEEEKQILDPSPIFSAAIQEHDENEEEKAQTKVDPHKAHENSTLETILNPILDETDSDSSDNDDSAPSYEVLLGAVLQRVQTSFDNMQGWEQRRAIRLNYHFSICDNVFKNISARVAMVTRGTEGVLKFFGNRKNQIDYYCSLSTKNYAPLSGLFSQQTLPDAGNSTLTKLLREYDEFHLLQAETNQNHSFFIQNTIINKVCLAHESALKLIKAFGLKITETRKRITKVNTKMGRKGIKYTTLVSKILNQDEIQAKKNSKDLYGKELSMVACAQIQTETYQDFGREVLKFCKLVEEAESLLLSTIRQALGAYIELMTKTFGASHGEPETVNKLLNAFKVDNEVQNLFSLDSLLAAEDAEYIKAHDDSLKGTQQLSNEQIEKFFQNCPFEPPTLKALILKEWRVFLESGRWRSFKPYDLIWTLDGNLVLVDRSDEKQCKKAEAIIKVSQMSLRRDIEMRNPHIVEIIEETPGFFMSTKKKYTMQFDKMDHIDELCHCLYKSKTYR